MIAIFILAGDVLYLLATSNICKCGYGFTMVQIRFVQEQIVNIKILKWRCWNDSLDTDEMNHHSVDKWDASDGVGLSCVGLL